MENNKETTYEYSWSAGKGRVVAAAVVGSTIEVIQEREGGACSPGALVDEARSEDSPIHSLFNWEDSEAAELYRTDQARGIIRNLRVRRVVDTEAAPAFISVQLAPPIVEGKDPSPPRRGYVPSARVMSEADLYSQALNDCLQQLRGLQKRFNWIKELGPVWREVEALGQEDK